MLIKLIEVVDRVKSVTSMSGGFIPLLRRTYSIYVSEGLGGVLTRIKRYMRFGVKSTVSLSEHLEDVNTPNLSRTKLVAFYLPQYHPIAENNLWWGKGFTEWTNVAKAQPNFDGHYQPHVPADLGFYDLRLEEARLAQAELAQEYGIAAFCYYVYWFSGKKLLNYPIDSVVSNGTPNHQFMICWANENWTRTWDGQESNLLIAQEYRDSDDIGFIQDHIHILRDKRYFRVNNKPLLLVYRISDLQNPKKTSEVWRKYCAENGVGEISLGCVQSFLQGDPRDYGFDIAVEFPPHGMGVPISKPDKMLNQKFRGIFYDYEATVGEYLKKELPNYPLFRGVMPSWDNTARRQDSGHIFLGARPEIYRDWLNYVVSQTSKIRPDEDNVVFINAWNEWAEGCHLEPDLRWGRKWLEATRDSLMVRSKA